MQGTADPNAELLDAASLCGHLIRRGSVAAFLAEHRKTLFPDDLFADLFPSGRGRLIPVARAVSLVAHDYDNDSGKPPWAWADPEAMDALITALVNDALTVISACEGLDLDQAQSEALGLLALVAGQDVEPGEA